MLTGAGLSTESGIPDYRDPDGKWKRSARPALYQDFIAKAEARQRYWGRGLVGYPLMRQARPNQGHRAIKRLQDAGIVATVITQNVDRLHQTAGTRDVIDLHGSSHEVICLGCGAISERAQFHRRLAAANPDWRTRPAAPAPDGDAELEQDFASFTVADCDRCGGIVKPNVVFFGENVPRSRVDAASAAVARSGGLLVIGSSLMVFSGFRFARQASRAGLGLAAVNLGRTRADDLFELKIAAPCGPCLTEVANAIERPAPPVRMAAGHSEEH